MVREGVGLERELERSIEALLERRASPEVFVEVFDLAMAARDRERPFATSHDVMVARKSVGFCELTLRGAPCERIETRDSPGSSYGLRGNEC